MIAEGSGGQGLGGGGQEEGNGDICNNVHNKNKVFKNAASAGHLCDLPFSA